MPIYEYVCADCRHQFELIQNGSTRPACPACDGERLEKQLSVFAVGARSDAGFQREAAGPCGTCGDPRGPGSCSMN